MIFLIGIVAGLLFALYCLIGNKITGKEFNYKDFFKMWLLTTIVVIVVWFLIVIIGGEAPV